MNMKTLTDKSTDERIHEVLKKALELVVPSERERKLAKKVEEEISRRLEDILKDYPELEYRFLGSYARDTWLKGELEIDVFILFPEHYETIDLEKIGLDIGKKVLDKYEIKYASHPYVHGEVLGANVDVVPCYKLNSPERIKSAVDRTPFHYEWLKDRIKGKENEVRLLKKFLKVSGLYGAEYKIRGFSGYLCELLIVMYENFLNLIKSAVNWTRNLYIDIEKKEVRAKPDLKNIFVADPVDKKRNVAANLSVDNLAKFVEKCRNFLEDPSLNYFLEEKVVIDYAKIKSELESRGTGLYVVVFNKPDIVEDNLYPQLEKACRKITKFLEKNEFMPIRSGFFASNYCYLVFETMLKTLPKIKKHAGPPFEIVNHAKRFISKKRQYRPFLENGRYYVYVERKYTNALDAISSFIKHEAEKLGKNVGQELKAGFKILTKSDEILNLEKDFIEYLTDFLCIK